MPLSARERELDGIVILALDGSLILGRESEFFHDTFAELLNTAKINVIADLKQVTRIDSTGLGNLVDAFSKFQHAGGAMKLLNVSKRHLDLLVLTKLSTVFEIFNDERSAIDSFFPDRKARKFDILDFVKEQGE